MTLSRVRKNGFGQFLEMMVSRAQELQEHVKKVIESGDFERADQFSQIILELASYHMEQIVENGGSTLLDVLIAHLEMQGSSCYRQLSFWRDLFRRVSRIDDDQERMAKLQQFEQVVLKLVTLVLRRVKMEDDMFYEFNTTSLEASHFEELFADRRDLGKLFKDICKSCGCVTIYGLLRTYLSDAVTRWEQATAA